MGFRSVIFYQLSWECGGWVGGKNTRDRKEQRREVESEEAESPTVMFFVEAGVLSIVIGRVTVAVLSKERVEKGMAADMKGIKEEGHWPHNTSPWNTLPTPLKNLILPPKLTSLPGSLH